MNTIILFMIPVIDPLSWITGFAKTLSLSYHQSKHLSRYITSLITSRTKTVTSMNSMFTDNLSSKSMNRFLTEYGWDAKQVNIERIQELQKHNETRWSKNGVAIIDDTLIHKTGEHIPGVYKFYDHSDNAYVDAQSITTLHYADRKTNYALDYRQYLPKGETGFKTKIQLAMEMLEQAINIGMPAMTVIFDAWYLCDDLTRFIESQGRYYIGGCRSNLNVMGDRGRYISLSKYVSGITEYREFEVNGKKLLVYTKNVRFRSIGRARLVVSKYGKKIICLATNRRDHVTNILADYMLRWKIEDFYKDAKQHLGLEKCQLRNAEGIKRHWYLVLLAHSVLKLGVSESIFGKSVIRSSIGMKVKRACIEVLEKFVLWVIDGKKSMEEVKEMLCDMLIYRQS